MQLTTDFIAQIAEECGMSVRRDYSGRGMYGATCFGVVADSPRQMPEFFAELADLGYRDAASELGAAMRQDNMGRDLIFYFPGVEFTDVQDADTLLHEETEWGQDEDEKLPHHSTLAAAGIEVPDGGCVTWKDMALELFRRQQGVLEMLQKQAER